MSEHKMFCICFHINIILGCSFMCHIFFRNFQKNRIRKTVVKVPSRLLAIFHRDSVAINLDPDTDSRKRQSTYLNDN